MNVDEARFILTACTRADLEHSDADVQEALRVAGSDPVLGAEWVREQALDRAVAARVAQVMPPPDLRARILAGERASLPAVSRRRAVLAWAAGLAVAFTGGGLAWNWNRRTPTTLARFSSDMIRYVTEEWDHTFDLTAPVAGDLVKALAAGTDGMRLELPANIRAMPTYGCRRFGWRGREVALICVQPEGSGAVVHVFTVPSVALNSPLTLGLGRTGPWNSVTWQTGDRTYVAVSMGPVDGLMPTG
jgi:hypothetical protein